LYYLDGKTTFADKALTALSCISVLGLSGVGCINEKENHTLHILCAGTFFIGYDLFMILRTVRKTVSLEMNKTNALLGCIAVVSSLLTWVRFFTSGQQVLIHFSGTFEKCSKLRSQCFGVLVQPSTILVVIIVRILFYSSFFFYCVFCNRIFQTNPNNLTNYLFYSVMPPTTSALRYG